VSGYGCPSRHCWGSSKTKDLQPRRAHWWPGPAGSLPLCP
jgi:hypothetical protein